MIKVIYLLARTLRRLGFQFHEDNDFRVKAMRETINRLGSIQFDIEISSDGAWVAESTNIDGIITGGSNKESINEHLKDAVFTYFEIPPHLCNETLVKTKDEPMKLEQKVYA